METATELPASTIATMIARFRKQPPASPAARAPPPKFWWLDDTSDPRGKVPQARTEPVIEQGHEDPVIEEVEEEVEEEEDHVSVASHASDVSDSLPPSPPYSPQRSLSNTSTSALFTPSRTRINDDDVSGSVDVSLTASRINALFPPLVLHNASSSNSSSSSQRSHQSQGSRESNRSSINDESRRSEHLSESGENIRYSDANLAESAALDAHDDLRSSSESRSSHNSLSNTSKIRSSTSIRVSSPPLIPASSLTDVEDDLETRAAALLKRCQLLLQQPLSKPFAPISPPASEDVISPWTSLEISKHPQPASPDPPSYPQVTSPEPPRYPQAAPSDPSYCPRTSSPRGSPESSAYLTARGVEDNRNDTSLSSHYNTDGEEPEEEVPTASPVRAAQSPEPHDSPLHADEPPSVNNGSMDSERLFMYISVSSDGSSLRESATKSGHDYAELHDDEGPVVLSRETAVQANENPEVVMTPHCQESPSLDITSITPTIVPVPLSMAEQFNQRCTLEYREVAPYLQDEVIAVMWRRLQQIHAQANKKLPLKKQYS